MKLSLWSVAAAPLLIVAGCAHSKSQAPTPDIAPRLGTTSAALDRSGGVPPNDRFAERTQPNVAPPPRHTVAPMSEWGKRYPDAAELLARWVQEYPQTATRLATWEKQNPERLRVLMDWAATHPYENLGAFLMNRAGWEDLQQIASDDGEGFGAFLDWIRSGPTASRELAIHPEGLAYADAHYGEYTHVNTTALAAQHRVKSAPASAPDVTNPNAGKPVGATSVTSGRVPAPAAPAANQTDNARDVPVPPHLSDPYAPKSK